MMAIHNPVQVSGSNIAFAEEAPSSGAGDDSNDLTSVASGDYASAHAVMVNEAGTVTVTMVGGTDWEAPAALVAGVWHPFPPFTRVKATGTSATGVQVGY